MQVLLINQNATIERLVSLSCNKLGFGLSKAVDIGNIADEECDFIIIDSDLYNAQEFEGVKNSFPSANCLIILPKSMQKPSEFEYSVEKPFLPTELVDILQNAKPKEGVFGDDSFAFGGDDLLPQETQDSTEDEMLLGFDNEPSDELQTDKELDMTFDEDIASEDMGEMPTDIIEPHIDEQLDDTDSMLAGLDMDIDMIEEDAQHAIEDAQELDDFADLGEESGTLLDEALMQETEPDLKPTQTASDELNGLDEIDDMDLPDFEDESPNELSIDTLPIDDEDLSTFEDSSALDLDMDDELAQFSDTHIESDFDEIKDEEPLAHEEENIPLPKDEELPEENHQSDQMKSIFDESEVSELKSLLEDADVFDIADISESIEDEDIDTQIKISNDELGSLTEESLAEALGVSIDEQDDIEAGLGMDDLDSDIVEPISIPSAQAAEKPQTKEQPQTISTSGQNIVLSLDTLKQLLEGVNININITLSKKD